VRSRIISLAILVALLGALIAFARPVPRVVPGRVLVGGQPYFLSGVNYPWKSGQEFGSGGWGYAGVATPTTNAEIDADFQNIAARGVRVVKWRVFNDGRYDPKRDANGYVTGVDRELYADLDAALRIADKYDLYLVIVMFGSGFWTADCMSGDTRFGGGAETLADPSRRASLIRNAVVPVVSYLGRSPRVLSFEIIAEPEWGVPGLNPGDEGKGLIQIPLEPLRDFVRETAFAIHLHTRALATVEANRASHMQLWKSLGLDYYSFSWYDWMEPYEPLDRRADSLGMDRPVVLGEFPASDSQYYTLPQVYDLAMRNGYAGAFAWSYWGGDGHKWQEVAQTHLDWNRANWPLVALQTGRQIPDEHPVLVAAPYAIGDPRLAASGSDVRVDLDVQVRQEGSYQLQMVLQTLDPPGAWQQERTQGAQLANSGQRRVSVRFNGLDDGKVYKLSLGVFDSNFKLLKWFDQVSLVELRQGAVQVPRLTTENPCKARVIDQ
jgi:hypothetical protein